jgi:hypothetical protein
MSMMMPLPPYWVENRSQFRPRSAAALRYELRQKGVDGESHRRGDCRSG